MQKKKRCSETKDFREICSGASPMRGFGTQMGPMQFWVRKVLHGIGFHSRSIHFRYSPQIEDFPKHVLFIWDIHSKDVSNFAQFHWSTDGATATKKSAFFCRDQPLCQFHSLAASGHSHWAYVPFGRKPNHWLRRGITYWNGLCRSIQYFLHASYIYMHIEMCDMCYVSFNQAMAETSWEIKSMFPISWSHGWWYHDDSPQCMYIYTYVYIYIYTYYVYIYTYICIYIHICTIYNLI